MDISKKMKTRLIVYALISSLGFSFLVMSARSELSLPFPLSLIFENSVSGIGVPVYVLFQAIMMLFIVPHKKRMFFLVPIFIIALNSFISSNNIWYDSNIIICFALAGCMFFKFDFRNDSLSQFARMLSKIFSHFSHFSLPFRWLSEVGKGKSGLLKRLLLALVITIPCVVFLIFMLASADMVFSVKTEGFLSALSGIINFNTIIKLIIGSVAGLYLFGSACSAYCQDEVTLPDEKNPKCDLLIINIFLSALLFVYTLFVIIQFKYLFAGSTLPRNLTYTEYARKGFFELLALTAVNIIIIFITKRKTKNSSGKWAIFSTLLCTYLCAVTVVLLFSSFFRMYLYTEVDGLTRLRFFVMGFLVFELLGLIATFVYIIKPKFNIILIYTVVALLYYATLNVVPVDRIIAKNQIDKYLEGERDDLYYIFTLSADAAPAMEHLYKNTDDEALKSEIMYFLEDKTNCQNSSWQAYNLSIERARVIKNNLK